MEKVTEYGKLERIRTYRKKQATKKNEGRGLKARLLSIGKELNYHEQNLVNLHERFRNLIDLVSALPRPRNTKQRLKSLRNSTFKAQSQTKTSKQ